MNGWWTCNHEQKEYKVMDITGNPWVGLVCLDCGVVMEWVESMNTITMPIFDPVVGNWVN